MVVQTVSFLTLNVKKCLWFLGGPPSSCVLICVNMKPYLNLDDFGVTHCSGWFTFHFLGKMIRTHWMF